MTQITLAPIISASNKDYDLKIKTEELEEVFLAKMLNLMFENIKFDPVGKKDSLFKSLLIDEYAKHIKLGIGANIANSIFNIQDINEQK